MTTVREGGYQKVIERALRKYQEVLEMTVATCMMVEDEDEAKATMKEWAKVGLALKKLERDTSDGTS